MIVIRRVNMNISLDSYRVFHAAARHVNFSKAAAELFVTQSSVSQTIAALEKELSSALFLRHGKRLALTKEGELLFGYIDRALEIISQGEKNIASINSLNSGLIRIGASDTLSRHFLLDYIKEFHDTYPNIKITINNRPSPISIDLIKREKIDFALINLSPNADYSNLNVTRVGDTRLVAVYSGKSDMYDPETGPMTISQLSSKPLILLEKNSTTRQVIDRFFSGMNMDLDPPFEFGSADVIIDMVGTGAGIAILGEDVASKGIAEGYLAEIPTDQPLPRVEIAIIYSGSSPLSKASSRFMDMLKSRP
jgi:DNA-binding transcriptional LysR family regulator